MHAGRDIRRRSARGAGPGAAAGALVVLVAACFVDEPHATSFGGTPGGTGEAASSDATTGATATTTTTTTTTTTDGATAGETTTTTTGDASSSSTTGALPSTCPDDPALLLCYSFEGDVSTVIEDSSASNLPGITANVAKGPGKIGDGVLLTTQSVIRVPAEEGPILSPLINAFTVAAWIDPDVASLPAKAGIIARAAHFDLSITRAGDIVRVSCFRNGGSVSTGPLTFRGWTHVACSYDGVDLRVFLDGLIVASIAITPATIVPHDLFLGNIGPTPKPGEAYVGGLDEVQVWSTALTPAQLCDAAGLVSCG